MWENFASIEIHKCVLVRSYLVDANVVIPGIHEPANCVYVLLWIRSTGNRLNHFFAPKQRGRFLKVRRQGSS